MSRRLVGAARCRCWPSTQLSESTHCSHMWRCPLVSDRGASGGDLGCACPVRPDIGSAAGVVADHPNGGSAWSADRLTREVMTGAVRERSPIDCQAYPRPAGESRMASAVLSRTPDAVPDDDGQRHFERTVHAGFVLVLLASMLRY